MESKGKAKKSTKRKTSKDLSVLETVEASSEAVEVPTPTSKLRLVIRFLLITLVLSGLAFLAYNYKQYFVSAKVGRGFIFTWELNNELTKKYGSSVLDEMITQKLIMNALTEGNVTVSGPEVDSKIQEIEKTLNGVTLKDALSMQGIPEPFFREQVELQLGIEKYMKGKVALTDEELNNYVDQYKDTLSGTTDDEKRSAAREYLADQKYRDLVSKWVEDLRSKAKIVKYI